MKKVMSSTYAPWWKRLLYHLPGLFLKCPEGNYHWRWNNYCECDDSNEKPRYAYAMGQWWPIIGRSQTKAANFGLLYGVDYSSRMMTSVLNRHRLNIAELGRQLIPVTPMPRGALPVHTPREETQHDEALEVLDRSLGDAPGIFEKGCICPMGGMAFDCPIHGVPEKKEPEGPRKNLWDHLKKE
jgi:hypothetical protein